MKHTFPLCFSQDAHAVYWDHIKSNKTQWIMAAMAAKFELEAKRPVHFAIEDRKRKRLGGVVPAPAESGVTEDAPIADTAPPSAPVAPKRGFEWVPDPADMQAGVYVVKPETFHTYNEGGTHRIEVVMGPAYPYGDNWPGQFVAWSPGDINAPFVPDPGVLAAALAHDEARIAAILARR